MTDIILTTTETYKITGYKNASAQVRWFVSVGIEAKKSAAGTTIVSRQAFEIAMGGVVQSKAKKVIEPNWANI